MWEVVGVILVLWLLVLSFTITIGIGQLYTGWTRRQIQSLVRWIKRTTSRLIKAVLRTLWRWTKELVRAAARWLAERLHRW